MTEAVPKFQLIEAPERWSELELLAATVFLESEGEPTEGKVAVAWVVRARADTWGKSVAEVLLQPAQFSSWNREYRARAEARLSGATGMVLEQSWRAAAGAYWRLIVNPVPDALYYLNVPVTLKLRGGTLPSWAADPANPAKINVAKVVGVIGLHTFLRN